tara:strand:+ start:268 stop:837 length:570 start_codon:yes stop_codon:yes gene_type:complete
MFKSIFKKKKEEETCYEVAGISFEKVNPQNIYKYDDIYHALKKFQKKKVWTKEGIQKIEKKAKMKMDYFIWKPLNNYPEDYKMNFSMFSSSLILKINEERTKEPGMLKYKTDEQLKEYWDELIKMNYFKPKNHKETYQFLLSKRGVRLNKDYIILNVNGFTDVNGWTDVINEKSFTYFNYDEGALPKKK